MVLYCWCDTLCIVPNWMILFSCKLISFSHNTEVFVSVSANNINVVVLPPKEIWWCCIFNLKFYYLLAQKSKASHSDGTSKEETLQFIILP